jgi:hypothetical protein
MFNFFLNNNDKAIHSLDKMIRGDGKFRLGIKMNDKIGMSLDDGNLYMKIGDKFGIDL